ncbi:MAG: hypothetical protein DMF98_20300 [Acidobacteria bacterium]|nr:MAG: hypothetical protein DMF98_20300 [Acidobacteriota bacterium]
MPELRLVVFALQDRLAYGPTFESAMAALFGGAPSTLSAPAQAAPRARRPHLAHRPRRPPATLARSSATPLATLPTISA